MAGRLRRAHDVLLLPLFFIGLILCLMITASATTILTLENKCTVTIWPGIATGNGAISGDGGFTLGPGTTYHVAAQPGWSGRIWARTGCNFNYAGNGRCATGDCGGRVGCTASGSPPATLVEFTVGSGGGGGATAMDFYDVSLVDGYNVGVSVRPHGGSGNCRSSGCAADINAICPRELQVVGDDYNGGGGGGAVVVGCKSACAAFGSPEFCCSGNHANPDTCHPTSYSRMFKNVCPEAYSYAYDDRSSLGTCSGSDYVITFCP